jgi:hypothetical protein
MPQQLTHPALQALINNQRGLVQAQPQVHAPQIYLDAAKQLEGPLGTAYHKAIQEGFNNAPAGTHPIEIVNQVADKFHAIPSNHLAIVNQGLNPETTAPTNSGAYANLNSLIAGR